MSPLIDVIRRNSIRRKLTQTLMSLLRLRSQGNADDIVSLPTLPMLQILRANPLMVTSLHRHTRLPLHPLKKKSNSNRPMMSNHRRGDSRTVQPRKTSSTTMRLGKERLPARGHSLQVRPRRMMSQRKLCQYGQRPLTLLLPTSKVNHLTLLTQGPMIHWPISTRADLPTRVVAPLTNGIRQ